ncbi:DUF4913 domain-containing protein [Arthrobacter sp. RIT-PI-e]|uniref:DUF4913 domain-containing protein n=1 Tax=Arthrobacter sp. RIT-PI-e TaxID=1681197 RepID=UPI0009E1CECC|nr:DUF4913 domain-containing protein [Arthrobacter sp. RIT-PI-e]
MSEHLTAATESGEDLEAVTPADLVEWVSYLVSRVESVDRSSGQHWCSQWWNHPEAIDRFRALHERWLEAQADGGMSSWWVDHFDRHASVLFSKRGPFGECGTTHVVSTTRRILATEQPPNGWSW